MDMTTNQIGGNQMGGYQMGGNQMGSNQILMQQQQSNADQLLNQQRLNLQYGGNALPMFEVPAILSDPRIFNFSGNEVNFLRKVS